METDAHLQIVLPGMTDWVVEEILDVNKEVIGYKVSRTQVATLTTVVSGNKHLLGGILRVMNARAAALNKAADHFVSPKL